MEELARIGVTHAIRIGSCGALQKEIRLGDLILVQGTVRDEGTSKTYIDSIYPAIPDFELMSACVKVAEEEQIPAHVGMARSHDSFYTDREDEIDALWAGRGVLGCDMETAALFVIGKLRGVKTAGVLFFSSEKLCGCISCVVLREFTVNILNIYQSDVQNLSQLVGTVTVDFSLIADRCMDPTKL